MLKNLIARTYLSANPQGAIITPRAHGIDISKYDRSFNPEFVTGQLDFVIQRASYRTTKDELFDQLNVGVQKVPIRGAYHYLNSDTDWKAQADKFISVVAGKGFHFFVCDLEETVNVLSTAFAYMAWQWIHYVEQQSGLKVLLYTSPNVYNLIVRPSESKYNIDWNTVDLWQAQWLYVPDPNKNPSTISGRTAGWKIWQYTKSGDGYAYGVGRSVVDLDVFNGTVIDMQTYLNISQSNVDYYYDGKVEVTNGRYENGGKPFDYHIIKFARADIKRLKTTAGPIKQKALTENFVADNNLHIGINMDEVISSTLSPKGWGLSGGIWYKNETSETGIWFKDNQPIAMQWNKPQQGETDVACGSNILVQNGEVWPNLDNVSADPRTILAYNDKFIIIFMIDGRLNPNEPGVTRRDIANYISFYGKVYESVDGKLNAHNLDGGGSSRAVVDGLIVNVPCETRNVINHIGWELELGGVVVPEELYEGTTLYRIGVWRTPKLQPKLAMTLKKGATRTGKLVEGDGLLWLEFNEKRLAPVRSLTDSTQKWMTLKKLVSPSPQESYYRVLHDVEIGGIWRAGLPEVFLFDPQAATPMNEELQWLMYDLFRWGAPSQDEARAENKWTSLYQYDRAFTNGTGFNDPSDLRANYISGDDLGYPLPRLDKYRVCGGASLKGTEGYSLMLALKTLPALLGQKIYALRTKDDFSFWNAVTANNVLNVETLKANALPTIEELVTKPWLYFHATTSRANGTIGRFPQGDGEPVLVPLVTKEPVTFPLNKLQKMDTIADPYKVYL